MERPRRVESKIAPITPNEISIGGVKVEKRLINYDERGFLIKSYDVDEEVEPSVYTYISLTYAGWARDRDRYHFHKLQKDRFTVFQGTFLVILFDQRVDSPTFGRLEVVKMCGGNSVLRQRMKIPTYTIIIPENVYHGIKNPGPGDAIITNHPTKCYRDGSDEGRVLFSNFPIKSLDGQCFSWDKVELGNLF